VKFEIQVDDRAVEDIIKAMSYYENQQSGLGDKFADSTEKYLDHLVKTAHYQIRYKTIRTLRVKPFPFMIHFTIDEGKKWVRVHAIIHTSLDPDKSWV
jgi:toxin ParE1/3/4